MSFTETQFPVKVSFGAAGGPKLPTSVVRLRSGFEHRNQPWEHALRMYSTSVGERDESELYDVLDFWEARRGPFEGFRWQDVADYKSGAAENAVTALDQSIGLGDDSAQTFQLVKEYGGTSPYTRIITKPVVGTVVVAIDGVVTTQFAYDFTTGYLIFPTAPTAGEVITAGFEFDVPVRFSEDNLNTSIEYFRAGEVTNVDVEEIRITTTAPTASDISDVTDFFNMVITEEQLPTYIEIG